MKSKIWSLYLPFLADVVNEFVDLHTFVHGNICIIFVIFRNIFELQECFVKLLKNFIFGNKSLILLKDMCNVFFISTFSCPKSGFVTSQAQKCQNATFMFQKFEMKPSFTRFGTDFVKSAYKRFELILRNTFYRLGRPFFELEWVNYFLIIEDMTDTINISICKKLAW